MKKLSLLYLFISPALFWSSPNTMAQIWHMLDGPIESSIMDIKIANDSVYVITGDANDTFGSLGGIFKRALDADDWKFTTVPSSDFLSLVVGSDGTYYVGAYGVMLLSVETEASSICRPILSFKGLRQNVVGLFSRLGSLL